MRIRKNANISELLKATSSPNTQKPVQINNCQLNQSPWDVISNFLPQSNPPPPPPLYQVNESGALAINGASLDSTWQRFNLKLDGNEESNSTISCKRGYSNDDNEDNQSDDIHKSRNLCRRTDGKGWQCKNKAATGSSMCKHHASLERKYGDKKLVSSETTKRRPRPKKGNPSNPYEFYYYSGFGPLWNKKRGACNDSGVKNSEDELGIDPMALYKFVQEDLGYSEKDDDKMEEKHERKRVRKPIKERSLKSLM